MNLEMTKEPREVPSQGERLQKVLARRGIGSRRVCEDLIAQGRVTVDGDQAQLGRRVISGQVLIEVDGVPIRGDDAFVYYLFHKPRQVVSSSRDPHGRKTVLDFFPPDPRVFCVGRLDYDSEGLIIVTNDGEFANQLAHPSQGVEKQYLVELDRDPTPGAISDLRRGVQLDDGITLPAKVSRTSPGVLKITIHEGRNRQIRRMAQALGYSVLRLIRVRIGNLQDRTLRPGEYRELTLEEIHDLSTISSGGQSLRQPPRRALGRARPEPIRTT